jgi:delta 1-pyrroline-5-carboxylate dehydrogenase
MDKLRQVQTICQKCGNERICDLQRACNETLHFRRIKSFIAKRDPVGEIARAGINIYKGINEIREDIYDFVIPDFIHYELMQCRDNKKNVSFTYSSILIFISSWKQGKISFKRKYKVKKL